MENWMKLIKALTALILAVCLLLAMLKILFQ